MTGEEKHVTLPDPGLQTDMFALRAISRTHAQTKRNDFLVCPPRPTYDYKPDFCARWKNRINPGL